MFLMSGGIQFCQVNTGMGNLFPFEIVFDFLLKNEKNGKSAKLSLKHFATIKFCFSLRK